MCQLDPDPTNLLGKNILDPALEARLIALGYIFAHQATDIYGRVQIGAYKRSRIEQQRHEKRDAHKSPAIIR